MMRAYAVHALLLGSSICSAEAEAKVALSPENETPGTCPSTPGIPDLRPRACASPEYIHKLSLSHPHMLSSDSSWVGPEHCINGICVFSNAVQNGGISLITSPQYAHVIQDYPLIADGGAYPPPFLAAEIAGKGIGLRANRSIAKGELLMVRGPTLVAHKDTLVEMDATALNSMYDIALARLNKDRRGAFEAQTGQRISDKVSANSFMTFVHGAAQEGSSHLACYPDIAKLNHDCRPNVHYRLNNMTITALAARDIQAGEELSVSYVDVFLQSRERKERIRNWGFECACELCQGTKSNTIASDKRLHRIKQLESDMDNFRAVKVTAETGVQYVTLHEEEGLYAQLGTAYTRAALNFALFGDEERSRKYAHKAAEHLSIEKGPESRDALAMRGLAADPKSHWTWGKRRDLSG